MAKRLSRSDYMYVYTIIITLACFIGGFFLGASVMKGKMENRMESLVQEYKTKEEHDKLLKEQKIYREPDFTSFYYNVYQPLELFLQEHSRYVASLPGKTRKEQLSLSKKMREVADETRKTVEQAVVPVTSPLLVKAKDEYVKSLVAYTEGIDAALKSGDSSGDLAAAPHLSRFQPSWLRAQADLYKAIALWEAAYVTKQPLPEHLPETISFAQWKTMPFHHRDYVVAEYLTKTNRVVDYRPEDVTARLDAILKADQAESLGWKDIPFAIRALQATNAVRPGDFKGLRDKQYQNIRTPQIPFFTE